MALKLEHYLIGKTLGVGAFGKVKRKIIHSFVLTNHYFSCQA